MGVGDWVGIGGIGPIQVRIDVYVHFSRSHNLCNLIG